ncbi:MAG: hypothetical protein N3A65_09720 [candidate division WOR-3 bacterium]|nr:hypothetical protein [candidate division WOR-3 bacterium]
MAQEKYNGVVQEMKSHGLIYQTMKQKISGIETSVLCHCGSGPDPCCLDRRGDWFKAIVACQNKKFFPDSSEKGPEKKVAVGGWLY